MDEELKGQVTELIQSTLGDFKASFSEEVSGMVNKANQGLAASLTREFKKLIPPPVEPAESTESKEEPTQDNHLEPTDSESAEGSNPGMLTLKALERKLKEQTDLVSSLQQERDEEKQATLAANRKSLLSGAIAKAGLVNGSILQDVLARRWEDKLTKEGDTWFIKDGENVTDFDDAFGKFVESDEGKVFLPPSGTTGAGSQESSQTNAPASEGPKTAEQALSEAFSNL